MAPRRWTLRHLMEGVETGMTTMAGMLSAWPERATPCAWLPSVVLVGVRVIIIDAGHTGRACDDTLLLFFVRETRHHVVSAADLE